MRPFDSALPCRENESDVCERLREIAKEFAGAGVDHFGVEANVVRVAGEPFEQGTRLRDLARPGQRLNHPEAAENEGSLSPGQAVVFPERQIAAQQRPCAQFLADPVDGGGDSRIIGRQKPDQRYAEIAGVHGVRGVVLDESVLSRVDAPSQYLRADDLGRTNPFFDLRTSPFESRGELDSPVQRDPAHDLRVNEVIGPGPDLPYAVARISPSFFCLIRDSAEQFPPALGQRFASGYQVVSAVQNFAVNVLLELDVRLVPNSHRPRPAVTLQVR